jgi:pimeloyl-ACP methyl ester carboxylesterase
MNEHFIDTNGIQLHYIEYPAPGKPVLVLLHGLTANAHAFDGLVAAGLNECFHLVMPDLRGRGLSDKPAFNYSMSNHAHDILGLLDHLNIKKAFIGGHSFGGLLSAYIAAHFSERVGALIILDAAAEMNPNTMQMLSSTIGRLDKVFPSYQDFIEQMKAAPQNTIWDEAMESYYRADAMIREDGTVTPYPNLANIIRAATGLANERWKDILSKIKQPAILVNAVEHYTMGEPLLPDFKAMETVKLMTNCEYVKVDGNHQTMLYANGAAQTVAAIEAFTGK